MGVIVRSWNLFHGNTDPPRRHGYLREMVELASRDRPAVLCLQEVPVWALPAWVDWSGAEAIDRGHTPVPLWPASDLGLDHACPSRPASGRPLPGRRTRFSSLADFAAEDLGHERISDRGRERRLVQAVRSRDRRRCQPPCQQRALAAGDPRRRARAGCVLRGSACAARRADRARRRLQPPAAVATRLRRGGPGIDHVLVRGARRRAARLVAASSDACRMASCSPITTGRAGGRVTFEQARAPVSGAGADRVPQRRHIRPARDADRRRDARGARPRHRGGTHRACPTSSVRSSCATAGARRSRG